MTSGIDRLLKIVQKDHDTFIEQKKHEAHLKGQAKYNAMLEEAKERSLKTKEKNKETVNQIASANRSKSQKMIQRDIELVQNDFGLKVLNAAKEGLVNLDSKQVVNLLDSVLSKHTQSQKPKILCTHKDYEAIMQVYGNQYQVIEDTSIRSGFVLAFDNYDVDYNFENLIEYHKEALMRIAISELFDEDKALWTI